MKLVPPDGTDTLKIPGWSKVLEMARIPARYLRVPRSVALDRELALWAEKHGESWSVLVHGPTGSGKTWIAVRLMGAICEAHLKRWEADPNIPKIRCRFVDASDWIERQKVGIRDESDRHVYDEAAKAHYLLLDDLGAERLTDYALDRLSLLLRHRHAYELPTIVTTNAKGLDALASGFDRRVASRFAEGIVFQTQSSDRRARKGP